MSTSRVVFKSMVFACAGMVVVYFAVGHLLAEGWQMTSTRHIEAPPERIAAVVSDLSTWQQWASVDATLGPQTERSVFGEPGTVGHGLRWTGSLGSAVLTLRTVAPDAIEYEFGGETPAGEQRPTSRGEITWQQDARGCAVTWHDAGTWPNLAGRWWGWFGAMQVRMRQLQSSSLEGLAERVEPRVLDGEMRKADVR